MQTTSYTTLSNMDTLISTAIEEICSCGSTGISLISLWSVLISISSQPEPLKAAFWKCLLSIPSLQFLVNDSSFTSTDPRIQCFKDAEALDLKIVANAHLRDCFVGLYDYPSSSICPVQRRTLERLAVSRTKGVTQNELAKELGIEGNSYFYRVRNLESRKLIVKQPAVVKTSKESTAVDWEGVEAKSSCVTTNLLYLSRYARHLSDQQRFEIHKGDVVADESDVAIKDFYPAMKAICHKLEEANDKVLIVSDIKQSLGYTGVSGHRAWRNICHRLKDACIVESFDAKVNGKVERCLRLLKNIPHDNIEKKNLGCGNECSKGHIVKFGRRTQQTEQLVELPIDHQIYDMIDAKRSEGATLNEVCGRLGLDRKRNDSRFHNLFSRFGMHIQAENQKRTIAFRVWTPENSYPEEPNAFLVKSEGIFCGNNISIINEGNSDVPGRSIEISQDCNNPNVEVDFATSRKPTDETIEDVCHGSPENHRVNHEVPIPDKVPPYFLDEPMAAASNEKLDLVSVEKDLAAAASEKALLKLPDPGSYQAHPYLPLTVDGALREQRILERLQNERFLLRVELHKWLLSLEKDKHTVMDRKTIDRLLSKLQQDGHCKCVEVNLPAVTNFISNRPIMVILHPSVQNFSSELLDEIHDRLRSFDRESRVQASSKLKTIEPVPVLNGVVRTHPRRSSDDQAVKVEAMRANGFVFAKMVRAKLLHSFLWVHLSSFPAGNDILSTGLCEHGHKLFSLEAAVKVLPIELFLKVVGSTKKFDNKNEKNKRNLLLSDLPTEEYRLLMDTQATGRLSLIIDILRRLKLIRLIRNGHSEYGEETRQESFIYAMELRPYIEEPLSMITTSNSRSLDLRPRIRHDFILSSREDVDDYWKTLEYCYSLADPRAALHSFPGSSVPEVFHPRFWTSVGVMSTYQRAELSKRIKSADLKRKISCEECEKIARDLNLSIQQVLRAYYGRHRQHVNIFKGVVNANEDLQAPKRRKNTPSKRKSPRESSSGKHGKINDANKQLAEQGHMQSPDTTDQFMEEHPSSERNADCSLAYHDGAHINSAEELASNQNDEQSVITQKTFSKPLPNQQKRFAWTDADDRKLLIQYTRQRAMLGAQIHRIDWSKVSELPAPPKICAKRVSSLKRNLQFRKALMNFCTLLGKRYANHLQKKQSAYLENSGRQVLVRHSTSKGVENAEKTGFEEEQWDDFSEKTIKQAFEGVLLYRQIAKSQALRGVGTASEDLSDLNTDMNSLESEPSTLSDDIYKDGHGMHKVPAPRSRHYRLHQKFLKSLNGRTFVNKQVHKSVAASNAVELLKLVFLSTSATPDLQSHLADTLRRYSEHDIFAAFSYLREKKIMIGGDGNQPFELSQQFLQNVSKSIFPSNTGKRAANFSAWLGKRERDLMNGGVSLETDLQCGDIFQLFALVSSGQLSISPCVPDEGVGEAEDVRSSKRKGENIELCDADKFKKLKSLTDGELTSRREKGFPGVMVLLNRASVLAVDAADLFNSVSACRSEHNCSVNLNVDLSQRVESTSSEHGNVPENVNFDCINPALRLSTESPWEAMAGYAGHLKMKASDTIQEILFSPEVFRTVYMAIQKAGDQGLSMEEISEIAGANIHEHIIDVLQAFGRVLKVNACDSVHIVDALYRSKYFLTSLDSFRQGLDPHSLKSLGSSELPVSTSEKHNTLGSAQNDSVMTDHHMHKVTILNLPEEELPSTERSNMHEGSLPDKILPEQNDIGSCKYSSNELRMPILPWINGNGRVNKAVYNALVRRVLGIVMKNPGIPKENIVHEVDVLNPQSCRTLLELMILDKHLIVRKMHQSISNAPPSLLGNLCGSSFKQSKSVYRKHLFANPMSASML